MPPETYEEWLSKLDKIFGSKIGLSHRDVTDYWWGNCYEAGDTPMDAFESWWEDNEDE